ncbi:MAG: choice-of-anchor C family protein [Nodosilinea sp.]
MKSKAFIKNHPLTSALVAAFLSLACQSAQAAAFSNGSFEIGPASGANLNIGSTAITGWTVFGHDVDYVSSLWQNTDGTKSVDLNGGSIGGIGGIAQTFDTVAGNTYQVLFDLAGNPAGDPAIKTLGVLAISGVPQDLVNPALTPQTFSFDITGKSFTNMGWQAQTYQFTATGASTTLGFFSSLASSYGPALDNVRVVANSPSPSPSPNNVPTPALLPGLIGMGVAAWRKRKAEMQAE